MKASIVSYLNTAPLLYGLNHAGLLPELDLHLDVPADSVKKLLNHEVDLSLVPVGGVVNMSQKWIGSFCIGATSAVRTVCLFSSLPVDKIKKIRLDPHSRTSALLIQILGKHYFKQNWSYESVKEVSDLQLAESSDAVLMIGDKVFENETGFKYRYDLAECWIDHTGLPFVFAAWMANKTLTDDFVRRFDESQRMGIEKISEVAAEVTKSRRYPGVDIPTYLQTNISYDLTEEKLQGLRLFNKLAGDLIQNRS